MKSRSIHARSLVIRRAWSVSNAPFWLTFMACALLAIATPVAAQKPPKAHVSMIASSNRVAVGEPFAVEIRADVSGEDVEDVEAPDFGALDVLGRRVSRPFSFSFGFGSGGQHAQVRNEVVYGYTLRANRAGTYKIPAAIVLIGNRKVATAPLTIEAVDAPAGLRGQRNLPSQLQQIPGFPQIPGLTAPDPSDAPEPEERVPAPPTGKLDGAKFDQNAFVRTVVDKPSAFLGEQVTITVYLYMRGGLTQNPSVAREPTTDGFWVHDLLPMQRNLASVRQDVEGRPFNVYVLRRYAAFPMREGTLRIGAPVVELSNGPSLFDLLNGPQKTVRREGVPVEVAVKALPAHPAGAAQVHVGSLTLKASLSQADAKVGDGVTLELLAEGTGNLRELRLTPPTLPGVDVLSPEIHDDVTTPLDQVGGKRTFRYLLLPRTPGETRIPPFSVDVFDPESARFQTVRSTPLNLLVTGAPATAQAAPTRADAATAAGATDDSGEDSVQFDGPRTASALRRHSVPLDAQPWFAWLVSALPLAAGMAYVGRAVWARSVRRRAANPPSAAERSSALLHEAAASSDVRRGLATVARALHSGIEAFAGQSLGGFPARSIAPRLVDIGLSEDAAARIGRLLESIDEARFLPTPPAQSALEAASGEARVLLANLAKARKKA